MTTEPKKLSGDRVAISQKEYLRLISQLGEARGLLMGWVASTGSADNVRARAVTRSFLEKSK